MNRTIFLTYAFVFMLVNLSFGQQALDTNIIRKIRLEEETNGKLMDLASYLTDETGPRLTGSTQLLQAQKWVMRELESWGLVNVQLEPWGNFGKGWEVLKIYVAINEPYYHSLIAIPRAWTPGTKGLMKGNVVFLKIDSVSELKAYKGKLKGKIVIIDTKGPEEHSFKPDAIRYSEEELKKMLPSNGQPNKQDSIDWNSPEAKAYLKAYHLKMDINAFLIKEGVGLKLSQAPGTDGTLFTGRGASHADTYETAVPELEVSSEDFQHILRLLRAHIIVTIEADIKTRFLSNNLNGYNVVGEIPGTDEKLKNQVVIIGAHLDSWHGAQGATDNAAGCATMMEVMRLLTTLGVKPRRTIRIVLWTGEEQGLLGSTGYVLNHFGNPKTVGFKSEQSLVSAYYNLDNGSGKIRGIYLQGDTAAVQIFQSWLSLFKDLEAETVSLQNSLYTDHVSFDGVGIPGFQFIQDPLDYLSRTHHSNQDTYDKLIQKDLEQAAIVITSIVYMTAQRDELIPRKPTPL